MTDSDLPERRRAPSRVRALAIASVLLLAGSPAFAAPFMGADSADQMAAGSASQSLVGSALAPERTMLSAADVNQLIEASQAVAGDKEPTGRIQALLQRAMGLLGTPYRWGGTSPDSGFDCSGLVNYVFRTTLGIELPRVSREMASNGEKVERAALTAGDLVFFGRRGTRVDHVGIYVGNGRFLHAPRTGRDVTVSALDGGYWAGKFKHARRVATH